jgi:gas vesicle protein
MSRDEGSAATVVLAFLVGAVSGAALALMFAPATGEETRKFLKDKAREGRDRANEAMEKGREVVKEGREALSEAFERGREVYERTRRENA